MPHQEVRADDYNLTAADARGLCGAVALPDEIRRLVLSRYVESHGTDALVNLFSQFIGLANSVVANNREAAEMLLVLGGAYHPDTAEKANLPTIAGALYGIALADGVDQSRTCDECAFRLGTCANQSASTTCDADLCLQLGEEDFMCHKDMDEEGNPTRKCSGFTQARKIRKRSGSRREV